MKIMKASAGSGKTYNLSENYLELLLSSAEPHPYRHILAVTFTNKATAEMKSRILNDLYELSDTKPKAKALLVDILHDYSSFAVSTIDKFFQKVLKSFSREIGAFTDYQIELDRNAIIKESMDRILDSLSEKNPDLLSWIISSIDQYYQQGTAVNIEKDLYAIGRQLKSEEHRELVERLGINEKSMYSQQRLTDTFDECSKIIEKFTSDINEFENFSYREGEKIEFYTNNKTAYKNNPDLAQVVDEGYIQYNTAYMIINKLYNLGLAGEFYKQFDALLKEKNLMCLDESNTILRDIINGSDAPFVYEKIGERYDHFLLDEFQDTSNIQWSNFLPLLHESQSRAGKSLIVGDVKQSIYRFRNSDWTLLAHKVNEEFPQAQVKVLGDNWRSTKEVVKFNNDFFTFAANALNLNELYSDVRQNPKTDDTQEGFVRVSFCDDQLQAVCDTIISAYNKGAKPNDIAILVRKNSEGSLIADYLLERGVSVISDDSLSLSSSLTVRRLVSLLSAFDKPEDKVSAYLAASMELEFPKNYHSIVDLCEYLLRSLRDYDKAAFDGETLFIQSFMDELQNWSSKYGNGISAFLDFWDEKERFIGSPESSNSVRIMTIHKSKGLEFPYVIFPYCEKVTCYHWDTHWCSFDMEDDELSLSSKGIYPVNLTNNCQYSLFSNAYFEEKSKQLVDNINIFYVALTRASKCLHLISAPVSKSFKNGLSKGKVDNYSSLSEILYQFVDAFDDCSFGKPYDFSKMPRKSSKGKKEYFEAKYETVALGDRLSPSTDAQDFFSEEGIATTSGSARLSGIALHDILSKISSVSDIDSLIDLSLRDGTIDKTLASSARALLKERVKAHSDWFPGSSGKNVQVLTEQSIIDTDGKEYRPDRVIISSNKDVLIIDFKFGKPYKSHIAQVKRYVSLYKAMNYNSVKGIVWYVADDKCEFI